MQAAYTFFNSNKAPERAYRDGFTIENYRMLFQRESSAYRDDVCRGVKRIRESFSFTIISDSSFFHQS